MQLKNSLALEKKNVSNYLMHNGETRGVPRGGALGHAPPLRSPNFALDIGLSWNKVTERRLIFQKTRFAPPPQTISKYAPGRDSINKIN